MATALSGMSVVHLIALGVLGELVVGTSDLSHTRLAEMAKKFIVANSNNPENQSGNGDANAYFRLSGSDINR
jgi:hypothetical protein